MEFEFVSTVNRKEIFIVDLEAWIITLLNQIQEAANRDENYDLHLESPMVAEIAKAYEDAKWIEIY